MVDVSGIPNMGFGGGGYFGGSAALGLPAMSAAQINASMYGGYSPGAAQSTLNNIYGAGGFGAQPAYYASLGAAYGRQTGGFGGYAPQAPAADPWNPYVTQLQQQGGGGDIWGGGAPAFNPYGGGANPGGFSPSPNYGGGGGGVSQAPAYSPAYTSQSPFIGSNQSAFSYDPSARFGGGGGWQAAYNAGNAAAIAAQQNPYAQMYRMPDANPGYFNPGSYGGDQGSFGIPYRGASMPGDIGYSQQSPMPNLGYNPGMQNWFANPGMGGGDFQGRFGMGFPNAGTPSQYYTGSASLPGMMPPGFAGLYGADNPGGALPASGFRLDQQ